MGISRAKFSAFVLIFLAFCPKKRANYSTTIFDKIGKEDKKSHFPLPLLKISSFAFSSLMCNSKTRDMQKTKSSSAHQSSERESEEVARFHNSLQELRELRSQLHYAADYCEKSFLKSKEKKIVVEGTKEYLCMAVVAVVDHLGCVSTNLDSCISKTNSFSEAELRINCLKQRVLSCEQYAHKLALARVRWNTNLPKIPRRYLFTQVKRSEPSNKDVVRDSESAASVKNVNKGGLDAEDLPLFLYTCTLESPSPELKSCEISKKNEDSSNALVPVCDGLSILSKGPNPKFHFQQITQKHGRHTVLRKSAHSNDILSLIRRTNRTT